MTGLTSLFQVVFNMSIAAGIVALIVMLVRTIWTFSSVDGNLEEDEELLESVFSAVDSFASVIRRTDEKAMALAEELIQVMTQGKEAEYTWQTMDEIFSEE